MTTLAEFLLDRIAEDEAVAQAVADSHEMWGWEAYVAQAGMYQEPASEFAERFHPDRVLAECAAKRQIVELRDGTEDCCEERYGPLRFDEGPLEAGVDSRGELTMRQSFAVQPYIGCVTLLLLATPYTDHPGYRAEWVL